MNRTPIDPTVAPLLLALALAGCVGTTDDVSPVAGDWLAVEYVVTNADAPSESVRLIPDSGWFAYYTFSPGGYYERSLWAADGSGWSGESGTWASSGSTLAVGLSADAVEEWEWRPLSDGRMEVIMEEAAGWDFDDDGSAEPTLETFTLLNADANPDPALLDDWVADSYTYTSTDDPSAAVDLIQEGGSYEIELFENAMFQLSATLPTADGGEHTSGGTGEFAAADGYLWLIEGTDVQFALYARDGGALVVTEEGAAWDFDGDGTDEPATLVIRLQPR